MTTILVAAEAEWVRNQVRTAFVGPGQEVVEVSRGQEVKGAVLEDLEKAPGISRATARQVYDFFHPGG